MNKIIRLALVTASLATLGGCASTYTNIEKTGESSYLVTRTKQGFFVTSGTLLQCQPQGDTKLACKEVGNP